MKEKQNAYKNAGVDIDAADELVRRIGPHVKNTNRTGVMGGLGGFGGLFDLKPLSFRDPVLVSATDGVGTKLRVAIESGLHDGVGIDLVAMSVNDLVVQGAEPLFFLDYFACGSLDVGVAETVIKGITEGCKQAGCALIGGETAEMPGMYEIGDYDLAGFCVGAAERDSLLPREDIVPGDVVLGLASSGLHSNGFSLVRKIIEDLGLSYQDPAPFDPAVSLGEALLEPTRIYVRSVLSALSAGLPVKALAHITGGGLLENIPRVLDDGLGVVLSADQWTMPPVFGWLAEKGRLSAKDMARTLNCGIGMVLVCPEGGAEDMKLYFEGQGERVYRLGMVTQYVGGPRVAINNMERLSCLAA